MAPHARALTGDPTSAPVASWGERVLRVAAYGLLFAIALAMFLPFVFAISTSFKALPEASAPDFRWIPQAPTVAAYRRLFEAGFVNAFINSLGIAIFVIGGRLAFNAMAAYALARIRFPGRQLLLSIIVASMFVPGVVLIVPRFLVLRQLELLNTYMGMILPLMTDAFGIFLLRQVFLSIPIELEESALVDGANRLELFFHIALPLSIPGLATMTIFAFQSSWNELIHYLVVSGTSPELYTVTLWLANLRGSGFQVDWPAMMAGSILTTLPTALLFIAFQRLFINSARDSGLSGL